HRHDNRIGGVTECSGRGVVCVNGGNYSSVAVVLDDDGKGSKAVSVVYPDRNGTPGTENRPVLGFSDRLWRGTLALSLQHRPHGIGECLLIAGTPRRP